MLLVGQPDKRENYRLHSNEIRATNIVKCTTTNKISKFLELVSYFIECNQVSILQ